MSRLVTSTRNVLGSFFEHGFAVIPRFLAKEEANALIAESEFILDKYYRETECQRLVSVEGYKLGNYAIINNGDVTVTCHADSFDKSGRLLVDKYKSLHSIGLKLHHVFEPFRKVTFSDNVKSALNRLQFGDPVVFESSVVFKAPGVGELPLHQDESYFRTEPPGTGLALWIALDDATPENGCLQVYPGSQRMSFLPRVFLEMNNTIKVVENNDAYEDIEESKFESVAVEKGSLVLIDGFLVHKSGANTTKTMRRAYHFHLYDRSRSQWMRNNYAKEANGYKFSAIFSTKK